MALNLPEVNQVTGNCFRMVRIVLKITFLELRYPKGVTGSVPLCPIMALDHVHCQSKSITVYHEAYAVDTLKKEIEAVKGRKMSFSHSHH